MQEWESVGNSDANMKISLYTWQVLENKYEVQEMQGIAYDKLCFETEYCFQSNYN